MLQQERFKDLNLRRGQLSILNFSLHEEKQDLLPHLYHYLPKYTRPDGDQCNRYSGLRGVARIAAAMATDLAAPDGHKWPRCAVRTAPGEDVPIGGLHDSKDMSRALVGHGDAVRTC